MVCLIQKTITGRFIYGEEWMNMTKKARFIETLDALSSDKKKEITDFFTKHPNYENHIDWNSKSLTYHDFEEVFTLAENSSRSIRRKAKTDPRLLFTKHNCEIIRQTDDFLIVVPLDWECAVFFDSFECGGEGARWCIGNSDDAAHWNNYLANNNVFFLIFFTNKHLVFGRKIIIQYRVKDNKYTLWLQNDTRSHGVSNIFKTSNISIEFIQERAEWLLGRIWSKDYLFDGSKLVKCYINYGTIDIPAAITIIEKDAFSDCRKINKIIVEQQNPRFIDVDGILFDKVENRIVCYPAEKKDACYMIPAGVISIGDWAFSGCESLTAINIPDSVIFIGDGAFYRCNSLAALNILDSVTSIGDYAFLGCESLTAINIPNSVAPIGDFAFLGCKNLTAIDIPNSVAPIGIFAFFGCKVLQPSIFLKVLLQFRLKKHMGKIIFYGLMIGLYFYTIFIL
jgi:hypothetical protein